MATRRERKKQQKKKEREKRKRGRPLGFLSDAPPDFPFIDSPSIGREKMSDVIMEFLEPYEEHWQTDEDLDRLLTVAMVAWNAALMSAEARETFLQRTLETIPPEIRLDWMSLVNDMIRRKMTHFAYNDRAILNYILTPTADGSPYLQVISTLGTM